MQFYSLCLSSRCPCLGALDIESLWNDFKYFVKNLTGKDLEEYEPISDASAFIQVFYF